MFGGGVTQREQVIDLFQRHGYRLTLGQILQTTLAAEYRARFTELRREGYTITCTKGKTASENLYTLEAPTIFQIEANGQVAFL